MAESHLFRLNLHVPAGPLAASAARHSLDGMAEVYDAETVERIRLLVNELVTNSFRHAGIGLGAPIAVRIEAVPDVIRVEVTDPGPGFTVHKRGDGDEIGGWGLVLVDRIARRWGVARARGATTVWFEMESSPHDRVRVLHASTPSRRLSERD